MIDRPSPEIDAPPPGFETFWTAEEAYGCGDVATAVKGYESALRLSRAHVEEPSSVQRGMEAVCIERLTEILTTAVSNATVDGDDGAAALLRDRLSRIQRPDLPADESWNDGLEDDRFEYFLPGQVRG